MIIKRNGNDDLLFELSRRLYHALYEDDKPRVRNLKRIFRQYGRLIEGFEHDYFTNHVYKLYKQGNIKWPSIWEVIANNDMVALLAIID